MSNETLTPETIEPAGTILVLAADPEEGIWSVVMQTNNYDEALDYWKDNPGDNSSRFVIDTSSFITFPVEEDKK